MAASTSFGMNTARPLFTVVAAIAMVLSFFGMTVGNVGAAIINIDDLTGTVKATVDGKAPTLLADSKGEFIHFTYTSTVAAANTGTWLISMIESGQFDSDRLRITQIAGVNTIDLMFGSDPDLTSGMADTIFMRTNEIGGFQTLINRRVITDGANPGGADPFRFDQGTGMIADVIAVASDVSTDNEGGEVPEPASLVMVNTSVLLGLGCWYYHRRRRVALASKHLRLG